MNFFEPNEHTGHEAGTLPQTVTSAGVLPGTGSTAVATSRTQPKLDQNHVSGAVRPDLEFVLPQSFSLEQLRQIGRGESYTLPDSASLQAPIPRNVATSAPSPSIGEREQSDIVASSGTRG
jgi:hypothetical protein